MDFELSSQAFHEAWRHFDLGAKPLSLNVAPRGILESERKSAESDAWTELRRIGFGDRDREDDLYGVFLPLHQYERAFDVIHRFVDSGEENRHSGMVCKVRQRATLAVLRGETVRIRTVPADSMARALLAVLPETRPGPGRSVSVPSAQLDSAAAKAGDSNQAMTEALVRLGVRRGDARTLVDMAGGERVAYAQFGASRMDGPGNRSRAAKVTNCFATGQGWYLMEETARGGESWTTFAPTDKTHMEPRVQALLTP